MRYTANTKNPKELIDVLHNTRLSWKARGLFTFIYECKDKTCDFDDIFRSSKDSIDSINGGIKELLKKKFISKVATGKDEGTVYIISDTYGSYKIGYAKSFYKRLKSYQTSLPYGPEVIKIIRSKNMRELEKELLNKYKEKRIRGEWFDLNEEDIQYLQNLPKSNNGNILAFLKAARRYFDVEVE